MKTMSETVEHKDLLALVVERYISEDMVKEALINNTILELASEYEDRIRYDYEYEMMKLILEEQRLAFLEADKKAMDEQMKLYVTQDVKIVEQAVKFRFGERGIGRKYAESKVIEGMNLESKEETLKRGQRVVEKMISPRYKFLLKANNISTATLREDRAIFYDAARNYHYIPDYIVYKARSYIRIMNSYKRKLREEEDND